MNASRTFGVACLTMGAIAIGLLLALATVGWFFGGGLDLIVSGLFQIFAVPAPLVALAGWAMCRSAPYWGDPS